MESKLPEHIQIRIAKEAESLANQWHYYPSGDEYRDIINAYKAGAEPWAQQCQQLAEALKGILLFCETNGEPCDGYRFREEVQNARKLLATWNEGIKPEDTNKTEKS